MALTFTKKVWDYNAWVVKITDGDTIWLNIDRGMRDYKVTSCRLLGIDASELNDTSEEERVKANAAKEYLISRLPIGCQVYIISNKLDRYDRPLITLYYKDVCINTEMVQKGLAEKY